MTRGWLRVGSILLAGIVWGGGAATAVSAGAELIHEIVPGAVAEADWIGRGWSHAETNPERTFRWMIAMEADLYWDWTEPEAVTLTLITGIAHQPYRRQRIGLFINNRYVTEWLAKDDSAFHAYTTAVPAVYWQSGPNRITLRAAYTTRLGADRRSLAVAVERLQFHRISAD